MIPFDAGSIHESAVVEDGVRLGAGSKVWDNAHLRRGAVVGRSCIVGEKTYIAGDAVVGDFVKLNAAVYICALVTIEDFVMVAAHTVFTNDVFPRAGNLALTDLETSAVTEETLKTRVRRGATIGANSTIGPGLDLGEFCMVGMGSVVTKDVPAHALVVGNPARVLGYLCACGHRVLRGAPTSFSAGAAPIEDTCARCKRVLRWSPAGVRVVSDPFRPA